MTIFCASLRSLAAIHRLCLLMKSPLLALLLAFCLPNLLFGWGQPHHAITRAALETLPGWQKELLGEEMKALGDAHCMIPDNVYSDKANAKYAAMESRPGEVYLQVLHLPTVQTEYLEVMTYFMERAVTALREGRTGDAARFMGTMCHQIEDYGSPSHTIPGDNQFTLLQQFLPPSDGMKNKLMHGPIENGDFTVSIAGYQPRLLGTSVNEAAWRLMHRVHEGILNARSTTIPIMQALYADDAEAVTKHQMRAAVVDAQIVADAMHTILCLGGAHRRVLAAGGGEAALPADAIFQLAVLGASASRFDPGRRHESGAAEAQAGFGREGIHPRHQRGHGQVVDLCAAEGRVSSLHGARGFAPGAGSERSRRIHDPRRWQTTHQHHFEWNRCRPEAGVRVERCFAAPTHAYRPRTRLEEQLRDLGGAEFDAMKSQRICFSSFSTKVVIRSSTLSV
jgi:hypothetical protein